MKNCRHHLKHRRRPVGEARIKIPNRASIHERPKEADGRRIGDLEMDTIVGKNNKGAIVTIIDRSTDWLVMKKLPHGKEAFADPHAPWQKGGIEHTKRPHKAIHTKRHRFQECKSTENKDDTKKN